MLLAMLLVATNALADEYSRSVTGGRQTEDINYSYRISGGEIKLEQKGDSYADYKGFIEEGGDFSIDASFLFKNEDARIDISCKFYDKHRREIGLDGTHGYGNATFSATFPEEAVEAECTIQFAACGRADIHYRVEHDSNSSEIDRGGLVGGYDDDEDDDDEDEEDDEDYEEDNDAEEEAGIKDYIIPISIGVLILGGGALVANNQRKKKKKDKKKDKKKKDDDEKQPDQLRMEIIKDFGDSLVVGDKPQQVSARMIRKPADGPEYVDMQLTKRIMITSGDQYLQVQDAGIAGDCKCAFVQAPEVVEGATPEEGIVDFRLASEAGSYTNHLHFKIESAQIVFGQDNLTIPAFYKKEIPLQFIVMGMERDDCEISLDIQPCSFQEHMQTHASTDYSVTPRWNAEKKTWEAVFKDQWLNDKADDHIAGDLYGYMLYVTAKSKGGLVIKGELPVFRMYMGLGLRVENGGEVGCYVEPYDSLHHIDNQAVVKQDGKEMTPAETRCWLVLYDWDDKKHEIITSYPIMEANGVKFKAPDGECQKMVNALGLNFQEQRTSTGKPYYVLRCRNAVLSAPNRFDVVVEIAINDKSEHADIVTSTYSRKITLLSQPRRHFDTPGAKDAALKKDDEIRENYYKLEDTIIFGGYIYQLEPLVDAIRLQLKYYDKAFGFDEHNRKAIFECFHHVLEGEQADADAHPLVACDNLREMCIEAFRAVQAGQHDIHWVDRIFLGVVTGGLSETVFAVVTGMGAVQKYVEKGGNSYWGAFVEGAVAVTYQYLFEKAITSGANFGKNYLKYMGNAKEAGSAWKKEMGDIMGKEIKDAGNLLSKGIEKVNSIKDYFIMKSNASKTSNLTKTAADSAKTEIIKAKAGVTKNQNALDVSNDLMKYGDECSNQVLDDLKTATWLRKFCRTEANERLLNRFIIKMQGDKQAMMKFKQALHKGDAAEAAANDISLQEVAKTFNSRMANAHDYINELMKRELAAMKGINPKDVHIGNPTSSSKLELKEGKDITFDYDGNYSFTDHNGVEQFFDQNATQNLYNRIYRDYWMKKAYGPSKPVDTSGMTPGQASKFYALNERLNRNFTQSSQDQTIVQDYINHPDSYGNSQNLRAMIDPAHQGERLSDPVKAAQTALNKGMERFRDGFKKLKDAKNMTDGAERLDTEYNGVGSLMEGCRQIVKIVDLLNKRAIHRTSEDVVNKIPMNLREGTEIMRIMTEGGMANIKQVAQALANKGLNFEEMTHEIYRTVLNMG